MDDDIDHTTGTDHTEVDAADTASRATGGTRGPAVGWVLAAAVVVVVLAVLTAFAVGERPGEDDTRAATAGLPDLEQDLAAHEWLLDRADSSLDGDDADPVTLVLADGRVTGAGPCNRYHGRFTVDDDHDTLTITDLAQTNRACDAATMRAEDEYLDALRRVRDVDLPGGYDRRRLELTSPERDRLAYRAVDVGELLRRTWYVVNVGRDDALESVVQGTEPTIAFGLDGEVVVATGCNQVRGSYEAGVDLFVVGALAGTQKLCDEPAGVMAQEDALVRALEAGRRIEVVSGQLTIVDGDGRTVLVAVDERSR